MASLFAISRTLWGRPVRHADHCRRKTGIVLPQSDVRDENGMEPIDGLFSSPEKAAASTPNGYTYTNDKTLGEAEMELDESTSPCAHLL